MRLIITPLNSFVISLVLSLVLMVLGIILSITLIFAIIGIPLFLIGLILLITCIFSFFKSLLTLSTPNKQQKPKQSLPKRKKSKGKVVDVSEHDGVYE